MLPQTFIQEMENELLKRQDMLKKELIGVKPHEELGMDWDSSVQEVEGDDVSKDVISRIKTDLQKIEIALGKVKDGSYGIDSEGKEISEARLRALPWADKAI